MELCLERSKGAPLQLDLDVSWGPECRDLITPYIQNTETLRCDSIVAVEDFTQTLPNFPQSTPNLRSLILEHAIDYPTRDPSTDPFESFPNTVTSLSLYDIPLYPSFLEIGTLTTLTLHHFEVRPPLDAFLDLLEGNRLLEYVDLTIDFDELPSPIPRHRDVIMSQIRHLSIACVDARIARTIVSSISLLRGSRLEITVYSGGAGLGLNDILSGTSVAQLPNLSLPTFMEYCSSPRNVRLAGPDGTFSYSHEWDDKDPFQGAPFMEFSILPLTNVRKVYLWHCVSPIFFHASSLPALEKLTIDGDPDSSHLSVLFSNPSASPLLKTLKFQNCAITEEFMEELTRFASDRKNTTSTRLHRVVIAPRDGKFPTTDSIRRLGKHVPIVEAGVEWVEPADPAQET